jgi:3-methyl-2-oxobutanoate hydroxymethyltransferase
VQERKKMTARRIMKMKGKQTIVMITAYDYPTARIVDEAGVDIILVGDSLGMVVYGMDSTHGVTMEDMVRHTSAVARAKPKALLVEDMPFGSYEPSVNVAVENAIQLVRAGAEAVKLEGGSEYTDRIKAIVNAGIPVMGHIGLTPQRYLKIGGYKLRGKSESEASTLIQDALELENSGVFSIVIEFTREEVARRITEKVSVPTICIGSGRYCDGQVLVFHDLLGLTREIPPFAKKYVDLYSIIKTAVERYASEVRMGVFTGKEHVPQP